MVFGVFRAWEKTEGARGPVVLNGYYYNSLGLDCNVIQLFTIAYNSLDLECYCIKDVFVTDIPRTNVLGDLLFRYKNLVFSMHKSDVLTCRLTQSAIMP